MAAKKRHARRRFASVKKTKDNNDCSQAAWLTPLLPPLVSPSPPPWRYLPWLLAIAFIMRSAIALAGDFVLHPDEVMQYLESAHGLVFGNSISHWEFYYGARSWLVPSVVAAVLFVCKTVGLDTPMFYIAAVKLFFCALSLLIPLSLYSLGRRMYGEASGRIALLLSVFWYELVGFAHKPMTEFVATSLLLLLMLYALRPQRLLLQQAVIASALAVFIIAVRFQYAPVVGLVWLVPFLRADNRIRLLMVISSFAMVLAVGVFDYLTWGGFMHSYWLNLKVNLVLDAFRTGEATHWYYFLGWPAVASGGLFLLALAAAFNYKRHLFLLLLCVAVLLPHMVQSHKEYRFIFILIPFWLLLCADFFAIGWQQRRQAAAARWRRPAGLCYAVLVSALGIANALPAQSWLYVANSAESGYVNFLRNQDEIFSIYRRLAADKSVRGVHDVTRPYFNSGGYYYLHHKVPFYDAVTTIYGPTVLKAEEYVSHIIARGLVKPVGIEFKDSEGGRGRLFMQTEKNGLYQLPSYISDISLNKLIYWDASGKATPVEGFTLSHVGDRFTIWKSEEGTPVRAWRRYSVFPDSEAMYLTVEKAGGKSGKKSPQNFGIEFSDAADAQ